MKKTLLIAAILLTGSTFAQTNVSVVFHHKYGNEDFAFNAVKSNNLGQSFKATRMEYYVTQYSIVHDGGQITPVSLDTISLLRAQEVVSTVNLGQFNVTTIEGIKFHIGVHSPANHEDPSLLPESHPLSFQSPSMHWGWTSGYRFIALEGKSGPSVNQTLELHGLGDENYHEVFLTVPAHSGTNGLEIHLHADYTVALFSININSGLVVHGSVNEAATLCANFRDYVFAPYALGLDEMNQTHFTMYPNPSNGEFHLLLNESVYNATVEVVDASGKVVKSVSCSSDTQVLTLSVDQPGFYLVNLKKDNLLIQSTKLINN